LNHIERDRIRSRR